MLHRLRLSRPSLRGYPRSMAVDLTVEILREIRDGIRAMHLDSNERFERIEKRLASVDQRLASVDQCFASVDQRLERVEQGLTDLGQFMRRIALDQSRHERFHTHHVELLEQDVVELKGRVGRLEERSGS